MLPGQDNIKIGIHPVKGSFSERWIDYCKANDIKWKYVNCLEDDIIRQLSDCSALMWHFSQNNPRASLIAKQLICSVEASGKKVFPDVNTCWHFDDKVGQKYLFEAINAPMPDTHIFYNKKEALNWIKLTDFPKVFKLRCGASSQNVRLVRSKRTAKKMVRKAFGRGFHVYDPLDNLKDRWRLYRMRKTNLLDPVKGLIRFVLPPQYARIKGPEKGYIYFQEFVPDNDHDVRVIVIGNKAFAIKRMVRANDFRASGSGQILYDRCLFDEGIIRLSFDLARKLKSQCSAFDYVCYCGRPLVVEVSYGFLPEKYEQCPGFWDREMNWHEGKFNPYGWMIEDLISNISTAQ